MKFLVLLFIIPVISSFTFSVAENNADMYCKYFHTGRFETGDKAVKEGFYILDRNDSIQTEYVVGTEKTATYRITWTNECEYTLDFITCKPITDRYMLPKKVKTKILETRGDSCYYKVSTDDFSMKTWMVKIRDEQ